MGSTNHEAGFRGFAENHGVPFVGVPLRVLGFRVKGRGRLCFREMPSGLKGSQLFFVQSDSATQPWARSHLEPLTGERLPHLQRRGRVLLQRRLRRRTLEAVAPCALQSGCHADPLKSHASLKNCQRYGREMLVWFCKSIRAKVHILIQ